MYITIIFLPLIGSIISGLFGSQIGNVNAMALTVTCIIIAFFISLLAFYEVALQGSPCYLELFK